jgi:DNA-binding CsgD family transcriptional regulator/tetratricopeptide (TPR) repeat protein/nucleoside-triphosphatase THEP1
MRPYGPLRGRDEVLAKALGVVRRTRVHGASGVVLISGEPGIGKTALLSEICRQATHTRIRVARSKCDEIEQACPGAPIIGLLRTGRDPLLTATEFREIAGLTGEPLVLVDRAAEHLERLAGDDRILIAVDDVQWADRLSRYALRSLISRLAGRSVVWVLASRSGDAGLTVSAADTVGVEHIRLEPLPRAMIAEIARDRLGNSLNGRVDELLDGAGGNPLLATHIIDGVARGAETGRDDEVPAEFRAAVYQRVAGLPNAGREIIEVLAAAGRALPISELPGLYDTTEGGGDDAVASVTSSGLVRSTGADLNFGHDLVRQAAYELIPSEKQRRLHTRLARHYAESAADPVLAAVHARAAAAVGDEPGARIMVAGAEALVATSAVDAAEFALQAFRTLRPGQPQWLELGERVVSVLSRAQRANDTIAVADRLLATVDDVDTISRIQIHAVKALWLSGRFSDLIDRAERGLALTTGRCDLAARFQAAQALAGTRTVGADAAAELADAALTQARVARDRDALALALRAAGEAAHSQRRHQLALKHFRELRSVTADSYLAEEIMQLQLLDRYDDAQMLLDAAHEDSRAKAESLLPDLLFAEAKQHYNLGHLAEADQAAEAVVELGQTIGTAVHVVEGTLIRAFVALLRGQAALAEQRLAPAIDITDGQPGEHPGVTFTRGWLTALQGDADGSRQILARLLAAPQQSRSYWAWWPCWMAIFFEVGIACSASDFTERAIEIAEEAAERNPDVATLTGLALNMRGVRNHDLAMVAESVRVLEHSPRRVLRAIGAEGYGTMLLDAGQTEAALRQLDAAWDDYDLMGASARRATVQRVMRQAGARRAKWVSDHGGSQPRSLTEAERRVAYLIAEGQTDKSAAKALGISVNTVGTHLRSAYAKLGVQSRVQLTNALRERGELN